MSPIHVVRRRPTPLAGIWVFNGPTSLAGFTGGSDVGYAGASIGSNGSTLFLVHLGDNGTGNRSPSEIAVRHNGVWHTQTLQPTSNAMGNQRITYVWIVPTTGAGAYVVGTHSATWGELGWNVPPGSDGVDLTYCFNATNAYYSPDWSVVPATVTRIPIVDFASQTGSNATGAYCHDAVLGGDGKLYVTIMYSNGTVGNFNTTGVPYQAVVNGTTVESSGLSNVMLNYAGALYNKYVLDGLGNPWMMSMPDELAIYMFKCVSGQPQANPQRLVRDSNQGWFPHWAKPSSGTAYSNNVAILYMPSVTTLQYFQLTYSGEANYAGTWSKGTEEQITTGLSNFQAVNAWGPHINRITRSPNGTVYATAHRDSGRFTQSGGGDHDYEIWKRTGTNTWALLHTGSTGIEAAGIMNGGNNNLYIEGYGVNTGMTDSYTTGVLT